MDSVSLQPNAVSLPLELVLSIIELIENLKDVLQCYLVSKAVNMYMHSSVTVQYKIALAATCRVETPALSGLSVRERYDRLIDQEGPWQQPILTEANKLTLPLRVDRVSGQVFFSHAHIHHLLTITDVRKYPKEDPERTVFSLEAFPECYTTIEASVDLLFIAEHRAVEGRSKFFLWYRWLPDPTKTHPLASKAMVESNEPPDAFTSFKIIGNIIHVDVPAEDADDDVLEYRRHIFWNWHKGERVTVLDGPYLSAAMLSPTAFVTSLAVRDGSFRLDVFSFGKDVKHPIRRASYHLPRDLPRTANWIVSNGMSSPTPSFTSTAEAKPLVLQLVARAQSQTISRYAIAKLSTFSEHIPADVDHTIPAPEKVPEYQWSEWAPKAVSWIPGSENYQEYYPISPSSANRVVIHTPGEDTLRVLDYNPYVTRPGLPTASTTPLPIPPPVSPPSELTVVTSPLPLTQRARLFGPEVSECHFPYRETVMKIAKEDLRRELAAGELLIRSVSENTIILVHQKRRNEAWVLKVGMSV